MGILALAPKGRSATVWALAGSPPSGTIPWVSVKRRTLPPDTLLALIHWILFTIHLDLTSQSCSAGSRTNASAWAEYATTHVTPVRQIAYVPRLISLIGTQRIGARALRAAANATMWRQPKSIPLMEKNCSCWIGRGEDVSETSWSLPYQGFNRE